MSYSLSISKNALKALHKLDRPVRNRLLDALQAIGELENPRSHGKALTGPLGTYWRYRVGDYRMICTIDDDHMCIVAVKIGHRSSIYQSGTY